MVMAEPLLIETIYVDFGRTKPHAILIGNSNDVILMKSLAELKARDCTIYLEEGCPKKELYKVAKDNKILLVDGARVGEPQIGFE